MSKEENDLMFYFSEAEKADFFRKALRYYADESKWKERMFMEDGCTYPYTKEIEFDQGNKARDILLLIDGEVGED